MASKSNGACAIRLEKTSAARCRSRHFPCCARRRTRRHPPPWSHALQPYLRSAHRSQMACVGCGRLFLEGSCPPAIPGTKHQQSDFSASLSLSSHTQTGPLVLSTLHTNDSISTITRLVDLGVPIYEISSSLTAVIAQRLIRRLCSCHHSGLPTDGVPRVRGTGRRANRAKSTEWLPNLRLHGLQRANWSLRNAVF